MEEIKEVSLKLDTILREGGYTFAGNCWELIHKLIELEKKQPKQKPVIPEKNQKALIKAINEVIREEGL